MSAGLKGTNPWASVWVSPRTTIGNIVKYDPNYFLWVLAGLNGLPLLLHVAQNMLLGQRYSVLIILVVAIVLAFVVGIINITLGTVFCWLTGKWLGGKSNFAKVRTAVAWSNAPNLVTAILWLSLVVIFQRHFFDGQYVNTTLVWQQALLVATGIIQLAVSIWTLVILIGGISKVQAFSIGKAVLNVLLSILLFIAASWLVMMAIMWVTHGTPV